MGLFSLNAGELRFLRRAAKKNLVENSWLSYGSASPTDVRRGLCPAVRCPFELMGLRPY